MEIGETRNGGGVGSVIPKGAFGNKIYQQYAIYCLSRRLHSSLLKIKIKGKERKEIIIRKKRRE